jgi:hypothetical protein
MLVNCISKYIHCMPRKTVSQRKARTNVKTRHTRRRTTRRRKGGECGDITKHGDYRNCKNAGCNKHQCAAVYNRVSKPHKSTVSDVDELAKLIQQFELRKKNTRNSRRTSRQTSKMNQPNLTVPVLDPAMDWRKYISDEE